ncbi:MAG: ATP-binding protein [Jaaginema sp. PMC 1079.18]|nr:ATP-binding protein [Jaaginema sp. PMC 1080.18]MEC4849980.1 ATP-binding protein [Jaaginema sp. PMC 1079.18]MEC4865190.1 ATP-binding protein [Jaaginema sp. PMC 1078.18]
MAESSQFSFRRILLLRLLLVSLPVLLLGMCITFAFTYRKGRSALLETARQNLTESAVRKGESISQLTAALKTNVAVASKTTVLTQGNLQDSQKFLKQLGQQLPTDISCVQLLSPQSQTPLASTCGDQAIYQFTEMNWSATPVSATDINSDRIFLKPLISTQDHSWELMLDAKQPNTSTLKLLVGAPVYDVNGNLRYILAVRSTLRQQENIQPRSLTGESVILNENDVILMHPDQNQVGKHISDQQSPEALERWQSLIRNAKAGRKDFQHLFPSNNTELLAGYAAIPNPTQLNPDSQWVIVALTPLNKALFGLSQIQRTLLFLLLGLSAALVLACLLATIYVARDLARPLEKLGNYALNVDRLHSDEQLAQHFTIREFNQLAIAINSMVKRLRTWALELNSAWEEAQTANRLKSEFLTTISHELRTPLNGIIGSLKLIQDGFCDDRAEEREFVKQADEAAMRLLGIIDDILDISKIEAGQFAVNLEQVNLAAVFSEVLSSQTFKIRQKGLKLSVKEWQEDIVVYADPEKFKQVLTNVLDNATKFTRTGKIDIKIFIDTNNHSEVIAASTPNGDRSPYTNQQVVLRVQDTGIGIAAENLPKLFRPFMMIDGSTTRESGGTGLGLAISRKIMELMGGSITLSSPGKNRGTTVELRLPALKTGKFATIDASSSELPDSGSGASDAIEQSS